MNSYDLCLELLHAKNAAELERRAQSYTRRLGFDHFMLAVQETTPGRRMRRMTSYPRRWLDRYEDQAYLERDPLVRHVVLNSHPVALSNAMFSSIGAQPLYEEAKSFGISAGACVPLEKSPKFIAGFSIARDEDADKAYREVRRLLPEINLLSTYAYEAFIQLDNALELRPTKLSRRETECVYLICQGRVDREISDKLRINSRTVSFHVANAARKLGARNRVELVARAIVLGLIEP